MARFLWNSCVGFLVIGALASLGPRGLRLMSTSTMDGVVGADPAPCESRFRSGKCDDYLSFCGSKVKADCSGQDCVSCTESSVAEQSCDLVKPWNALICDNDEPTAGGCGTYLPNTSCQWSVAQNKCKCLGGDPLMLPCQRQTATSAGVGSCQIVP